MRKVSYHVHSLRGGNKEPEKRTDISLPGLSGNEDGVCSASKIAQVMVSKSRGGPCCDEEVGPSNHE